MIKAEIIADSENLCGNRITTWILTYPRFIHSEFMTHRVFSRNAASSRAIPITKMISSVKDNPAMPEYWGKNQKGMQASEELSVEEQEKAKAIWLDARDAAIGYVLQLSDIPAHKQIANRLLEPWFHITVLATATDYENFFALRAHKDAQPEFQKLAYTMLELYNSQKPALIKPGEWHVPFADKHCEGMSLEEKLKVCTARAARTSYLTFDGKIDPKEDFRLHDMLMEGGHWSPFEHAAQALDEPIYVGNFKGWKQYRKTFSAEYRTDPRVKK